MPPVEPNPASSVVLIRPARQPRPIEVYMIRRASRMRFLGGYHAFPGGKVEPSDFAPESLARCSGLSADAAGRPLDLRDPAVASRVERCRLAMMNGASSLGELLAAEEWFLDLRPLRYLSHFITPASSPIRFTARFFLSPLPAGQEPRLFLEETSEGLWVTPRDGYTRFRAGEMAMAEPAEYTLGYLAQFESYAAVWANHVDGRPKFRGIVDRFDFYGEGYDWAGGTWKFNKPAWHA